MSAANRRSSSGLIITRSFAPYDEPELTVDDLDVAQLLYLIVNNHKIRDVIDTMTSKTVLILGRFTTERKRILDAIRTRLRERGYVPIVFDFKPSTSRDLTETVQLLAGLSRFVVADLTDAKSVPQELSHIVASLPSVPVQPLLLRGEREYAMFEHWRRYPWVLPKYEYADESDLLDCFDVRVIEPLEKWRQPESLSAQLDAATRTIEELSRRLDSSSTALSEGAE